jgi:predicted enzyme related to lactoylglutathione lyase
LFWWKFNKYSSPSGSEAMPEGMEYGLTSTVNDKGNKALGGGMITRESPEKQRFTNYFDVKSVREYSAKVAVV